MLRITGIASEERDPDPLDDARIHPEVYKLAVSMCSKALEGSKSSSTNDDDQLVVELAISERFNKRIEALDLVVKHGNSHLLPHLIDSHHFIMCPAKSATLSCHLTSSNHAEVQQACCA